MSAFISGGCKNGKSAWALRIVSAWPGPRYYVATMIPRDGEDRARVERHRLERAGLGFATIERGTDILGALDAADPRGSFLLDSVTALLANEMFPPGGVDAGAADRVAGALEAFVRRAPNTVLVSDFIYSDAARYDPLTEAYRQGLARVDRRLAAACDTVLEVVAGQIIVHKGEFPL